MRNAVEEGFWRRELVEVGVSRANFTRTTSTKEHIPARTSITVNISIPSSSTMASPECEVIDGTTVKPSRKTSIKKELRTERWTNAEEMTVAHAKKEMVTREMVDTKFKMKTNEEKWGEVAKTMSEANGKEYTGEGVLKKWHNISQDFKKIFNYQQRSGVQDWWGMSTLAEKKATGIVLNKMAFTQELFVLVASFMADRPAVNGENVVESNKPMKEEKDEFSTEKKRKRKEPEVENAEDKVKCTCFYWNPRQL